MSPATKTKAARTWDEPANVSSARGWLMQESNGVRQAVGFYLNYGAGGPARPRHSSEWCRPGSHCSDCEQPDVLAVRYPKGPGTEPRETRWCVTVEEARRWIETGRVR